MLSRLTEWDEVDWLGMILLCMAYLAAPVSISGWVFIAICTIVWVMNEDLPSGDIPLSSNGRTKGFEP